MRSVDDKAQPHPSVSAPATQEITESPSSTIRTNSLSSVLSRGFDIEITAKTGVYFLLSAEVLVYIGQSLDVEERIAAHRKKGRIAFDRAVWIEVAAKDLDAYEGALIRVFNPPLTEASPADCARDVEILSLFGLIPDANARSAFAERRRSVQWDAAARNRARTRIKLNAELVAALRAEARSGVKAKVLAEKYGISSAQTCRILHRDCWKEIP